MPRKTKEQKEEKIIEIQDFAKSKNVSKKATTTKKSKAKSTVVELPKAKTSKKTDSVKKETTKNKSSKVKSTTSKKNVAKVATKKPRKTTSSSKKKSAASLAKPQILEYYDLPYRYNQTVVKILYQTPNNLFVYWDISEEDRENYKKIYGDNFFEATKPVLIVYNDTMNYKFEVEINDFANSWYLRINDSKCNYRIELGRRPIYFTEKLHDNYIYVSMSNKIESPNDRILSNFNINSTLTFRNVKNQHNRDVKLEEILNHFAQFQNSTNSKDFPYSSNTMLNKLKHINNLTEYYKTLYNDNNSAEFSTKLAPSSNGNSSDISSGFRPF